MNKSISMIDHIMICYIMICFLVVFMFFKPNSVKAYKYILDLILVYYHTHTALEFVFALQENTGVSDEDFVSYVNRWCEVGASLVGGCCRTTPNTIKAIYRTLSNRSAPALPP